MAKKITNCVIITSLAGGEIKFEKKYIIDEGYMNINNMHVEMLPEGSYIPKEGDKLYFLPGCDVPRFKVKQFCETFKVSLVKYAEKANVIFAGPNVIRELVSGFSYTGYNKLELLDYFGKVLPSGPDYQSLVTAIEESTSEFVYIDWRPLQDLKKTIFGFTAFKLKEIDYDVRASVAFRSEADYNRFVHIQSTPGTYSQNEILKRINTGGIMTQEHYESIKRMLNSNDQENVKLAMEAMANCDYEKSCVPLLLLMVEYGQKMWGSPTRNHVNFKSLLKFFEVRNVGNVDFNEVVSALLKRKLLNKTNLDMLLPMAKELIKGRSGLNHFGVKEIEYDETISKGLQENVLDQDCNTEVVDDLFEEINPRI